VAKFDKVIPPGQEGKVQLVIEGKKVHGKFSKSATIHSNDPEHPVMTISITADITPYIDIQPPQRVYLQGRYGEKVEKTLQIRSNEEDLDFKITKVESNIDDKITYKLEPSEDGEYYQLRIWKNPKLPTVSTYGSLFLHTNSERIPEKTIQVQVITKGTFTVQPSVVNFGNVQFGEKGKDGKPVSKAMTILKSEGDFQIEDITFSSDRYSAEIVPLLYGKRYKVKVKFTPPEKEQDRQNHSAQMIIHTDDPREPSVTVRLIARSM
jgi:hypothetical protein